MLGWRKWVAAIKTGVVSVAEVVSVCSDSNYNQQATHGKRGTKNRRQTQTR
jgi:hypothetical protein